MIKFLNKFLNNKSNFTEDTQLKVLNDEFYYLLEIEKNLLKQVVRRNIKYYFQYKKLYIARVVFIMTIYFAIVIGGIGGTLFTLNYFNIIRISKAVPTIDAPLTVYLPDTDTISQNECTKLGIKYIIFFPYDSKKSWKLYKIAIHNIESKGLNDSSSYYARSSTGEYWGRYQLGSGARKLVGLGGMSWKQFSSNREIQEGAFLTWVRLTKISMQPEINKYVGQTMNGVQITESGIISMAHNVGEGAARGFLNSNGANIPNAGYAMKFLKVGGYNLDLK
jgi:hypothetical protein